MNSYAEGGSRQQGRDPVVRVLLGCLAVAAVLGAIVLAIAFVVGWTLTRDEAPGRSVESFFVGDETRYWKLDLRADDAGMAALFDRFEKINDETRRKALKGTLLESLPLPHRRAALDQLAPFTLEFAVAPSSWSARGTVSKGMLKLRAGLKMMRWLSGRNREKSTTAPIDGVEVTELHDNGMRLAFATVGNRILVASDGARLGSMLGTTSSPAPVRADLIERHAAVKLDGEDAWGLITDSQLGEPQSPVAIGGAVASFDVNERDELAFRVAVLPAPAGTEGRRFSGSREECLVVAQSLMPGVSADRIQVDEAGSTFTGRIEDLSKVFGTLLTSFTESRMKRESFAIPIPPSPPTPSDRRSDTPAAPRHGESPSPPR